MVEGLNNGMTAVIFLNDTINTGQYRLTRLEQGLRALDDLHNKNTREGNDAENGCRHGNGDAEHHKENAQQSGNGGDDLGDNQTPPAVRP